MSRWNRPEVGSFVLRVGLGIIFFLHGWMNVIGGQEAFVREMFVMIGWSLPNFLLVLVTILELLGGLALILGVLARLAALLLATEMVVAVLAFHIGQGFFIVAIPNAPLAYGFEYHISLVAGLVCLALTGSGVWSLGPLIKRGGVEESDLSSS